MSIGVDCGTRGSKALVVDDCGRVRNRGYAGYRVIARDSGARGKARRPWGADASVIARARRGRLSPAHIPQRRPLIDAPRRGRTPIPPSPLRLT